MQWIGEWQARVSAEDAEQRVKKMHAANPKFVLRNYLALNAIDAAEQARGFFCYGRYDASLAQPLRRTPGLRAICSKATGLGHQQARLHHADLL